MPASVDLLLALFAHFLLLSLLAIGGAITVAPDMHRVLVDQMGLLTDAQFNSSIAIGKSPDRKMGVTNFSASNQANCHSWRT